MTTFVLFTDPQSNVAEHWLTTSVPGLIIIGVIAIFFAWLIAKISAKSWRTYLRKRFWFRVLSFLHANVRPFGISRLLTNRYIHRKDYFRYVSHTGFTITAFTLSSVTVLLLMAIIAAYFIVNGVRFSWTLFVVFSLTGFFLLGWIRDFFYLPGIIAICHTKEKRGQISTFNISKRAATILGWTVSKG